jgi:hypothetical protein
MDQRFAAQDARIRGQETRREVIGAVDDQVVTRHQFGRVLDGESFRMERDLEPRIYFRQSFGGGNGLRQPQGIKAVQDLAVEIAEVDFIRIGDAHEADPGRRQIQRRRRPEATRAQDQDLGRLQLELTGFAHAGQTHLPGIEFPFMRAKAFFRRHPSMQCKPCPAVKPRPPQSRD